MKLPVTANCLENYKSCCLEIIYCIAGIFKRKSIYMYKVWIEVVSFFIRNIFNQYFVWCVCPKSGNSLDHSVSDTCII